MPNKIKKSAPGNSFYLQKEKLYTILTITDSNLNSIIAPKVKSELNALSSLTDEGVNNLILDISNVKHMDASGLSVVLAANRLWKNKGNFVLSGIVHEPVKQVVEISRLETVMEIKETVDEAIIFIVSKNSDTEIEC